MVTFEKTINSSEHRYGYLNLSDDEGKKYGDIFPSPKTPLIILTKGESYLASMNSNPNQIWGGLCKWFREENIHVGDKIKISYDPKKIKDGEREIVEISLLQEVNIKEELKEQIEIIKNTVGSCLWYFYNNEENVRCAIIEPVLSTLGWAFPHLYREKNVIKNREKKVDYALIKDNKIEVIIEVKSLEGESDTLTEKDNLQIREYMSACKTKYGILTNGVYWKFIESSHKEKSNTLAEFNILENDINDVTNFFISLSYNRIESMSEIGSLKISLIDKEAVKKKELKVIFKGGKPIQEKNATATFIETIKKLDEIVGIEKINAIDEEQVGFHYVAVSKEEKKHRFSDEFEAKNGKFYYITKDYSTAQKKALLNEIIYRLGLNDEITIESV